MIANILGRAWFYEDDPTELELWEHEFVPMDGRRSGVEWCREHLECLSDEDLRDLLGAPDMGNFQVLFRGTMQGWACDGDEYDEMFHLEESKIDGIPQELIDMIDKDRRKPKND